MSIESTMNSAIEITDSDDDMQPTTAVANPKASCSSESSQTTPEKQYKTPDSVDSKTGTTDSTASTSNTTTPSQPKAQARQRARKTQLTIRNTAENDIQFISMGSDEKKIKLQSISNVLIADEINEVIQEIANERVRCNFLLATYKLPDMNFSLYTHPNTLKTQFSERLQKKVERTKPSTTAATTADCVSKETAKTITK